MAVLVWRRRSRVDHMTEDVLDKGNHKEDTKFMATNSIYFSYQKYNKKGFSEHNTSILEEVQ